MRISKQYEKETSREVSTTSEFYSVAYVLWLERKVEEIQKREQEPCENCKGWNDKAIMANFCFNCGRALKK
ncbi:MAG: hypothetical protein HOG03_24130 [Desulfobacula sp.]|jgi:hypothetical protein|uniref:hypothetical protein n=1 Tax=Desulfobacula sp. TaxID=2593537 RepID=UPI001ECA3CDF|nr:hypothetical protein [Desulfobacula sp.]